MEKTLHFKTNTLLKNLVGKDLINDDNIAVVELVKNAYDARSPKVTIRFERFDESEMTTPDSKLIIMDQGNGMDDGDIEHKWLNIAYSDKKLTPQEPGEYLAGNKGIGRFSCDRLGAELDLLTQKRNDRLYHLRINWPDFEVEGQRDLLIQKIPVTLKTISVKQAEQIVGTAIPRQGTTLVISKLRSTWDREKLLKLRRSLEKFVNPNQLFQKNNFRIELEAEELKEQDSEQDEINRVNGIVENQVFSRLQFNSTFIETEIDSSGTTINTSLSHEGEVVFRLEEKNVTPLKNVKAVIYYLNPYKKAYFKRQTGRRSIDFGSIFLFLNGFRIAPYGDRGDDWLGLDVRKTQGTTRYLSNRDLVGRVEIIDKANSFEPISSREGLKNTPAFALLKDDFVMEAIRRLEKFVVDGLDWDSIPQHLRTQLRAEEGLDWKETPEEYSETWEKKRQRVALAMLTFLGSSQDKIKNFWFSPSLLEGIQEDRAQEVSDLLQEIEGTDSEIQPGFKQSISRFRKLLREKEEEARIARGEAANLRITVTRQRQRIGKLRQEAATYQRQTLFLQAAGTLDAKDLLTFHHEILLNANIIDNYIARARKSLLGPQNNAEALQYLQKISLANKKVIAVAQFATKANFRSNASKEVTDIAAFFEQYILNVAKDFIATGIEVKVNNGATRPFELRVRRIEMSIIIDNIISNASKAQARTLVVDIIETSNTTLRIIFADDGRGLSEGIRNPDDIFQPGVTTTAGSGLGLSHVKQIMQELGGNIKAMPRKPKGLEIVLEFSR